MKAKQALHPGAVIVRRDPSQQPGIIVLRQHLDGGIDFQPGAARVIHQNRQARSLPRRLPVVMYCRLPPKSAIARVASSSRWRNPAARRDAGCRASRFAITLPDKTVAGGDHLLFAGAETFSPALAIRRLPQTIASHFILNVHHIRRDGNIEKVPGIDPPNAL